MRVLVTGGSGYIGSHAVRDLAAAGHEVVILDNLSTGNPALAKGFRLVQGDIADRELLKSLLADVDAVMHFAASAYVGESVSNPRKYFHNNVESALLLMDSVLESSVRQFVFSSTCATYGIPDKLPITETSHQKPINPYGVTKLFFEDVLSAYSVAHGLRYVALRYFNAAGAHPNGEIGEIHHPETHLIPLTLKAALGTAPPLTVFGKDLDTPDGTCIRDFIHVSDLATAHTAAVAYLENGGASTAINLGTGKGTSIAELLAIVEEVSGKPVPHVYAAPRAGDPPALYSDPSKAKEVLGWKSKYDIRDIIETAYQWELKLPSFLAQ
ncbi:UDP-glucose 4-epimerase/UDP-arabinose 4-epimerase [Granulicella pectinivorans]|jgi:UDP-glucose-4-epimerase GalE|uniref:UDP-glucose 4-epimerase n=1 Tax=Granulicella pectinivorans TaxID=474950 RepID=A0A1I6M752_9BACT|nr:UDP-glucose 4-epimerase GalE [Granulicella pectinivorans]SFS11438.1 UDP-glucose 4-epimerase/UDP-arabinose 4-epimerase [Granulicella pectinivorans]